MESTEEQWRGIPGYENAYESSTHGRVRSLDRQVRGRDGRSTRCNGRILKPWANGASGHMTVALGGRNRKYVHRIVLESFIGPCPDGMEACHSDDNPSNNNLANLRWASRSDNSFDRQRNGIDPRVNMTHCKYGHEFTEANTHRRSGGGRQCKACRLRRKREENDRNRKS